MKSAGIPKWGQTDRDLYRQTLGNFKHLNHKDSNGWIWFVFGFVFKLPDPKINKICASKTEKAALLKYIWRSLKISFPHAAIYQFSWENDVLIISRCIKCHTTILRYFPQAWNIAL